MRKSFRVKNEFGSYDIFIDHQKCGWFHSCYECGSLIMDKEVHYIQTYGLFNGHFICGECFNKITKKKGRKASESKRANKRTK